MSLNEGNQPYRVIVDDAGYRSLWPADQAAPDGWQDAGMWGTKAECLAYMNDLLPYGAQAGPSPEPVGDRYRSEHAFVAPRTPTEKLVAALCAELLQLETVGIHDNFFDLGARSLHLALARRKLQDAFDRDVPLIKLFEHPTVQALAEYLDREDPGLMLSEQHTSRVERLAAGKQRLKQQLRRRQPAKDV